MPLQWQKHSLQVFEIQERVGVSPPQEHVDLQTFSRIVKLLHYTYAEQHLLVLIFSRKHQRSPFVFSTHYLWARTFMSLLSVPLLPPNGLNKGIAASKWPVSETLTEHWLFEQRVWREGTTKPKRGSYSPSHLHSIKEAI